MSAPSVLERLGLYHATMSLSPGTRLGPSAGGSALQLVKRWAAPSDGISVFVTPRGESRA